MSYTVLKALHIIFMVSWFAGLFYIVRLFIYHTEAQDKGEQEKKILGEQFKIMERKLWWIITTPAMVLTVLFGTLMLIENTALLKLGWMHLKLTFVVLLLVYHFICQKIMRKLDKNSFTWNSNQLRLWNEVATLGLVDIVFLVIMYDRLDRITGTSGFIATSVELMIRHKHHQH